MNQLQPEKPAQNPAPMAGFAPTPAAPGAIDDALLKQAYNAFKKRYKLTKLDHESKLGGHRPTSAGLKAEGLGIHPPNQFPAHVWQALAKQGRIKDLGGGFYSVV
jgi:hypothetical protein